VWGNPANQPKASRKGPEGTKKRRMREEEGAPLSDPKCFSSTGRPTMPLEIAWRVLRSDLGDAEILSTLGGGSSQDENLKWRCLNKY